MVGLQDEKLPTIARITSQSPPFWGLVISLVILFLMGGSSRGDVQSLALLNPAMIGCCGAALLMLQRKHLQENKWLLVSLLLTFLLVLAYLIPMARGVAGHASGRANLAAITTAVNADSAHYILATTPAIARQSLYFLFAPLAIALFAIQLTRDDLRLTVPLMIGIGSVSGVLGVIQLAESANGPLYFYRITNNGSAVGLFANRNHAAVFLACLFPLLAVFAARSRATKPSGRNIKQLLSIAISILLVPLILVTGSRSGMLTAIVGLIGGVLLYMSYAPPKIGSKAAISVTALVTASGLLCLVLATIYFSRAQAIERVFADTGLVNDRSEFWNASFPLFSQYFPLGFGPGGFVPAFQNIEPSTVLGGSYLNRLHNDWLETALTFGVPGILFLAIGSIYYVYRSYILWVQMGGTRSAVASGRMASVVIAILGIASLSDYPLRTPAMAGFAALVLVWFVYARRDSRIDR